MAHAQEYCDAGSWWEASNLIVVALLSQTINQSINHTHMQVAVAPPQTDCELVCTSTSYFVNRNDIHKYKPRCKPSGKGYTSTGPVLRSIPYAHNTIYPGLECCWDHRPRWVLSVANGDEKADKQNLHH